MLEKFQPRTATGSLLAELRLNKARSGQEIVYCQGETSPSKNNDRARESSSIEGMPYLIATIGQIGLEKGQDVLAAAALAIIQRVPRRHFLLIGERTSQKDESVEFERSIHHCLRHGLDSPNTCTFWDIEKTSIPY